MKTIKNSKEITTLEVGDKIIFGNLEYTVNHNGGYFLAIPKGRYDKIFTNLNIDKKDFVKNLGISTLSFNWDFPETYSLEALTAIVSALFKEYEKQNELPKTWEEFCEKYSTVDQTDYFISSSSHIIPLAKGVRHRSFDKNVCASKQEAEAFLALMQLRQLRKAYVKDWEPDWASDIEPKYCIELMDNSFDVQCWYHMNNPFSFPTLKLAVQFFNNFKDLLEIAKPLL